MELPIRPHSVQKYILLLHERYLRNDKHDNFVEQLINAYSITIDEAEKFHLIYHCDNPRRVSEGFCHNYNKVVTIIPIYGISEQDFVNKDRGR